MIKFDDLLFRFYTILDVEYKNFGKLYISKNSKIFGKMNSKNHLSVTDLWNKDYTDFVNSFKSATIKEWVHYIYDAAISIRSAEKCFMYKNDQDNIIYAEETKDTKTFYYNNVSTYKCKISFEKTKINSLSYDNIDESLNKIFEDDNNVVFVTIEVKRNFGKEMTNTFKFLSTSEPTCNDHNDSIMLKVIMNDITNTVINEYNSILNNILTDQYWIHSYY